MAQFIVRNLENDVHSRLRELAACEGKSMEEFVRDLLRGIALGPQEPEPPVGSQMVALFSKSGLTDEETIPEFKGEDVRSLEFE